MPPDILMYLLNIHFNYRLLRYATINLQYATINVRCTGIHGDRCPFYNNPLISFSVGALRTKKKVDLFYL